jgi:hypothetical protein
MRGNTKMTYTRVTSVLRWRGRGAGNGRRNRREGERGRDEDHASVKLAPTESNVPKNNVDTGRNAAKATVLLRIQARPTGAQKREKQETIEDGVVTVFVATTADASFPTRVLHLSAVSDS